jgi:uncharacterized protein
MPGATLTGVEDDTFTGTVKVKVGPISMTYQGKGRFVERDEAARRVVIEASGKDTRAAGTASATVSSTMVDEGGATRVDVTTDLTVTGRPAQFGRGMIADISAKLIGQFADCLAQTLAAPPQEAPPALPEEDGASAAVAPAAPPEPEAEPIDLLRLTGSTPAARRFAAYGIGVLILAVLAWVTVRWLRN